MLKIRLNATDSKLFEETYWKWFKSYQLKYLMNVIDTSTALQRFFFKSAAGYKTWKHTNLTGKKAKDVPDDQYKKIKEVILTQPLNLEARKSEIDKSISLSKKSAEYNFFMNAYTSIRSSKMLSTIYMDYLKLKTCPYCNRSFLSNAEKKSGKVYMTVELDHYYPKESNPIMAILLYNLIPCCHTCNHLKSNSKAKLIYPYMAEYGQDAKFTFDKLSVVRQQLNLNQLNHKSKLEISIKSNDASKQNAIDTFELNELYKSHMTDAVDLIHKKIIFTDEKINEICTNYLSKNGYSREQILAFVFSHYIQEEKHSDKILSKFLNDLFDDLKDNGI